MLVRSLKHRMNRTLVLTALAAGLAASPLAAQTAAAPTPAHTAPAAPAPPAPPQAIPAKIAIIAFEAAVMNTNEGEKTVADIQKKYDPKKNAIEAGGKELDSLKEQLKALPASTTDEERARREKTIDTKEKALQRDVEDAQNSYQSDLQEAYGKVAQKVGATAVKYCQDNGFTLMMNETSNQQTPSPLMWWQPTTDITQAVINAYNVSSGVAPPPPPTPSAPTPARRPTPAKP
jgi:Skp family chaperone for outer membrane proteins